MKEAYDWLVVHSLRSGLPTELQSLSEIPENIVKMLGRWHSSCFSLYQKSKVEADQASLVLQNTLIELANQSSNEIHTNTVLVPSVSKS